MQIYSKTYIACSMTTSTINANMAIIDNAKVRITFIIAYDWNINCSKNRTDTVRTIRISAPSSGSDSVARRRIGSTCQGNSLDIFI